MSEAGSDQDNGGTPETPTGADALREDVIAMIKTCYDP